MLPVLTQVGNWLGVGSLSWAAITTIVLLWAFVIYGFHPAAQWKYRKIPGPPNRWLVGGLPQVGRLGMENAFATWAKEYGGDHGVFKVFLGGRPCVVVCSPALSKLVFTRLVTKFVFPLVGHGEEDKKMGENSMLLAPGGPVWKTMRNAWTPEFHSQRIKSHFTMMQTNVEKLLETVGATAAEGGDVEVWSLMGRLTMNVIATASSGISVDTLGSKIDMNEEQELADKLIANIRTELETVDLEDPSLGLLFLFPQLQLLVQKLAGMFPSVTQKKGMEARKVLCSIMSQLIRSIRHHDDASTARVDPNSFLYAMAHVKDPATGQPHDEMWVLMQALLFVMAGYETTATALAYMIHLLAKNPDKQAKLREDIDTLGKDWTPTYVNVQELPYLNAVLNETLRLLPPAPFTIRQAKDDMQLGPYKVDEGTWMYVSMWTMHRSPLYWNNPLEFIPERFIPGAPEAQGVNPDALAAFGGGARKCPGYQFAQTEARLAMLKLIQNFTFHLPLDKSKTELKMKTMITLTPLNGVWVQIRRR